MSGIGQDKGRSLACTMYLRSALARRLSVAALDSELTGLFLKIVDSLYYTVVGCCI